MSGVGFLLDLGRCVGCGACVLACRLENRLPDRVAWRRVLPFNIRRYPGGPSYHFSLACNHCDQPACLRACPAGAYEKRADGLVTLDQQRCLGCRYCELACPFGAPSYDFAAGVMTKCHLCTNRLDAGLTPACVAACPTEALWLQQAGHEEPDAGWGVSEGPAFPGFSDPARCGPCIRFIRPRGRLRTDLLIHLREALER